MVANNSSSSKAIYTAVPLFPPHQDRQDEDSSTRINDGGVERHDGENKMKSSEWSTILHFFGGFCMGLACYYGVERFILPMIPHTKHSFSDCFVSSLAWSAITTIVAYTLWFGFISIFRVCSDDPKVNNGSEDETVELADALFWEKMEFFYSKGVFVGFSTSCVISLAVAGVPSLFLVAVIVTALVWTRIMACAGRSELHKLCNKKKTTLPMMIV